MRYSHSIRRLLHSLVLAAAATLAWGCGDSAGQDPVDAGQTPDGGGQDLVDTDLGSDGGGPGPDSTQDADTTAVENVAGRHDLTVTVDGLERELIVYVPELAAGRVEAPVVFMFHGTSGDGQRFYNISGWRELADEEGLIAVFPSALTHCFYEDENDDGDFDDPGERKITTKWASGRLGVEFPLCTDEEMANLGPERRAMVDHPLADDVLFFDAMLELLAADFVIDDRRVYTSGFSNGGGMSSLLAASRSDRIAAAAAASGFLHPDAPSPADRPLSMVVSFGEVEDNMLERLGLDAMPLDETALEVEFVSDVVDNYLALLQLEGDFSHQTNEVAGQTISRFTWSTSAAGADNELQLVIVEGLHHNYPNGRNHPIVIVEPLWTFFSAHSLE